MASANSVRSARAVRSALGREVRFLEPVHLRTAQHVLVTFTEPLDEARDGALASGAALAVDWLRDEVDAAWPHLQPSELPAGQPS